MEIPNFQISKREISRSKTWELAEFLKASIHGHVQKSAVLRGRKIITLSFNYQLVTILQR